MKKLKAWSEKATMTFDDFIVMGIESSDYNMHMDAQQKIYIAILEAFKKRKY